MRLKFQKRSAVKLVSRIIPQSRDNKTPSPDVWRVSDDTFGSACFTKINL